MTRKDSTTAMKRGHVSLIKSDISLNDSILIFS